MQLYNPLPDKHFEENENNTAQHEHKNSLNSLYSIDTYKLYNFCNSLAGAACFLLAISVNLLSTTVLAPDS
jgi:hypothetical protein